MLSSYFGSISKEASCTLLLSIFMKNVICKVSKWSSVSSRGNLILKWAANIIQILLRSDSIQIDKIATIL